MKLTLSEGKEFTGKDGSTAIMFNVFFEIEDDLKISIKGFRYKNKGIWLPSVRTKGGYMQLAHFSDAIIEGLYQAVQQEEWAKDIKPLKDALMGDRMDSRSLALGGFTE